MKTIKAYEFKDLEPDIQEGVRKETINEEVKIKLDMLENLLQKGDITEKKFYKTIGCSKDYAENTAWFIPAVYYDNNKEAVDKEVDELLKTWLFTADGRFIQTI